MHVAQTISSEKVATPPYLHRCVLFSPYLRPASLVLTSRPNEDIDQRKATPEVQFIVSVTPLVTHFLFSIQSSSTSCVGFFSRHFSPSFSPKPTNASIQPWQPNGRPRPSPHHPAGGYAHESRWRGTARSRGAFDFLVLVVLERPGVVGRLVLLLRVSEPKDLAVWIFVLKFWWR